MSIDHGFTQGVPDSSIIKIKTSAIRMRARAGRSVKEQKAEFDLLELLVYDLADFALGNA